MNRCCCKTKPRLPAEWEPQDAVIIAWPHEQTDWQPILDQVTDLYIELVVHICRFETVIVIAPEIKKIHNLLQKKTIEPSRLILRQIETDDTWIRDYGPLTVYTNNQPRILDFIFNGWGQKFTASRDNQVTLHLHNMEIFGKTLREPVDLVLEGGSIETDGNGTVLTTSACLLNPNRNPHQDKLNLEAELSRHFGFDHFLWLDHGWLAGDDTDSHIDTLARLCPNNTILYVQCNDSDDEHYLALKKMEQQLQQFKTKDKEPFKLIPLPWPQACYDGTDRLPASYANFLILNNAVLVPVYHDAADALAMEAVGRAFHGREIIGIDCRPLIKQHGSLHCITMQLPQGVLS